MAAKLPHRIFDCDTNVTEQEDAFIRYIDPKFPDQAITFRRGLIGVGIDFPHAEGLAEPESFVQTMTTLTSADIRKVMRDNGRALLPLST